MKLPADIVNYIAENIKNDIRQIEGAVKKIYAKCYLNSEAITFDMAKECISTFILSENVKITPEQIISYIAKKYGISQEEILGRSRVRPTARARNVSIYVIRKITSLSLNSIGSLFDRDHTTVLNSYNTVEHERETDSLFDIEIGEIINELTE